MEAQYCRKKTLCKKKQLSKLVKVGHHINILILMVRQHLYSPSQNYEIISNTFHWAQIHFSILDQQYFFILQLYYTIHTSTVYKYPTALAPSTYLHSYLLLTTCLYHNIYIYYFTTLLHNLFILQCIHFAINHQATTVLLYFMLYYIPIFNFCTI